MESNEKWYTSPSLIVPIGTLIISLLISQFQSKIGLGHILVAVFISTLIYLTQLLLLKHQVSNLVDDNKIKTESLKQIINRSLKVGDKPYLMDTDEGVEYEKSLKHCSTCEDKTKCNHAENKCQLFCDEIWLFTPDLEEDKEGGPYSKVVSDNLKKGIKYSYIVPEDTGPIHLLAKEIKKNNKNHHNLEFVYLQESFFFISSNLDISVYNPVRTRGCTRKSFMGLPAEGNSERYQIAVSDDLVSNIVDTVLKIKSKNGN